MSPDFTDEEFGFDFAEELGTFDPDDAADSPRVAASDSEEGGAAGLEPGRRRRRRRRRSRRGGTAEGGPATNQAGTPQRSSSGTASGTGTNGSTQASSGGGTGGTSGSGQGERTRSRRGRGGEGRGDSRGGGGGGTGTDRRDGGRGRGRNRNRRGAPTGSTDSAARLRDRADRDPRPYNDAPRSDDDPSRDQLEEGSIIFGDGVLELHDKGGYGFLRDTKNNYSAGKDDIFVPGSLVEKHKLRQGVLLRGEVIAGYRNQGPRLRSITAIDDMNPEDWQKVKSFDELTAINPFEQIRLETGPAPVTMRVMDLLTPIGKGQRALLVAPPRSGKTMLLQEIANAVSTNHPEIHLIVLLIDERPEEVTDMRRKVRGEVIASSMDRDVESHVRISQLIIERGKRLAEEGKDVFILLDSITRTARAFNKWISSGRTGTGGLDIKALDIPKKMFGTARRFEEGGSLTVAATALVETGSRMDDVIFQEFKGTGNMELVLNRALADRRIWPALDVTQSGTRREEKILSPETLEGVTLLRRSLISLNPVEAMEQLIKTLGRFPSNAEFLAKIRTML